MSPASNTEPSEKITKSLAIFKSGNDFRAFPYLKKQTELLCNAGASKENDSRGGYVFSAAQFESIKKKIEDNLLDSIELDLSDELSISDFRALAPTEQMAYTEKYYSQAIENQKTSNKFFVLFCQALSELVENLKHGSTLSFFVNNLKISERTGEKWVAIGKGLKDFNPADVGGFARSQIEVIATFSDAAKKAIISGRIKATVRNLYALKKNEEKVIDGATDVESVKHRIEAFIKNQKEQANSRLEILFAPNPEKSDSAEKRSRDQMKSQGKDLYLSDELKKIETLMEKVVETANQASVDISASAKQVKLGDRDEVTKTLEHLASLSRSIETSVSSLDDASRELIENGGDE